MFHNLLYEVARTRPLDCSPSPEQVRVWDLRPYVAGQRQTRVLTGASHSFERNLLRVAWSPDGSFAAAGSSDRFVYIWDVVRQ